MTKTHKYKSKRTIKIWKQWFSRTRATGGGDYWRGGPQQMSMSVSLWKKRLSSNVWDVLFFSKIAMPVLSALDMPAEILAARIVHEQMIPLQIKGKDAVDYWNLKTRP